LFVALGDVMMDGPWPNGMGLSPEFGTKFQEVPLYFGDRPALIIVKHSGTPHKLRSASMPKVGLVSAAISIQCYL